MTGARLGRIHLVLPGLLLLSQVFPPLVTAVAAQGAAAPERTTVVYLPGSELTIRGSTTVGAKWQCTGGGRDVSAAAVVAEDAKDAALDALRSVAVTVPVWALECQSGKMKRALRKALRAERDSTSTIAGRFESHWSQPTSEMSEVVYLDGTLTVAGVERRVRLDLHEERAEDGSLHVRGTAILSLASFSIVPPRVLFGAIRARDAIQVEVDLRVVSVPQPH